MHYLDYNEKKTPLGLWIFPIEYYHVNEHHPVITCHSTVIKLEIIRILRESI